MKEGQPHIVDAIINGEIDLLINTTDGDAAISDSYSIRRSALLTGIPYFTTLTASEAAVKSLEKWLKGDYEIYALQDLVERKTRKRSKTIQKPKARSREKLSLYQGA